MLELLLTYKYLILIPLAIVEGPIVMIICGFLVTLGILNPLFVYMIIVMGDIVGDVTQYCIGYYGKRFLHYFKITDEKLEKAKIYFSENHTKTIILSKLLYGIGFTGIVVAGAAHIPFVRYIKTSMLISAVQSAVLLIIGILFGHMYVVIGKYLNYYAAFASVIALVVILFIFIRKYKLGTKTSL